MPSNSTSGIIIRNHILPGDIGSIIMLHGILYAQAYGFDHTFEPYVAIPLAQFVQDDRDGNRIWIVEKDKRVLGSIAIVQVDEKSAQLRWLILHTDVRGCGIGQKLIKKAIAFCHSYGYQKIYLWTIDFLTEAKQLYLDSGFILKESKTHELWGRMLTEEYYELNLKDAHFRSRS